MPVVRPLLRELLVENLLLIERARLVLNPGFNVLTGETGVGKTMLTRALDLLLGAKADRAVVRPGAEQCYVEASFDVPSDWAERQPEWREYLDPGQEVVLARRVTAQGRSRALVGGRTVSLEVLRGLAAALISYYGQHEQRQLMLETVQADMLDRYGGGDGVSLREAYLQARRQALQAERHCRQLQQQVDRIDQQHQLARYQLQELEQVAPLPGEEAELLRELRRLEQAVEAQHALAALESMATHEGGVGEQLLQVEGLIGGLEDPAAQALAARVAGLRLELEDLGREGSALEGHWEQDPERRHQVSARLELLADLGRKHRCSPEELAGRLQQLQVEVAQAEQLPQQLEEARQASERTLRRAQKRAQQLSSWRAAAAPALATAVEADLPQLAFQGARFEVRLQPLGDSGLAGLGEQGAERVCFLLQANPGLPLEELGRAASGGEASRLLLALVAHCPRSDGGLLVLDEPDAGLGGQTAHDVGRRLAQLAQHQQVLAVSHLPQLAARAQAHFLLEKDQESGQTRTGLVVLGDRDQRIDELCRMAGHDPANAQARQVAESLLS